MKPLLTALLSGTLFGAGLAISQMTNPAKVIGFLNVAGSWDPSLAFVMGSALAVSAVAFRVERISAVRAGSPPTSASVSGDVDRRLLLGACLFGLGWGLAGFCPGPAIAAIIVGSQQVFLFVGSMLVGMLLFKLFDDQTARARAARARSRRAA